MGWTDHMVGYGCDISYGIITVCLMMCDVEVGLGQILLYFFFFQAEDGIRDYKVTGVQTCALPIWSWSEKPVPRWSNTTSWRPRSTGSSVIAKSGRSGVAAWPGPPARAITVPVFEIGRASCRERV